MREFEIPATKKTPQVSFKEGLLEIVGVSFPDNSTTFYKPVISNFKQYCEYPKPETRIVVNLEIVNSGSMREITNLLLVADTIFNKGFVVSVEWMYHKEGDDMQESGVVLQSLFNMPLKCVLLQEA